MTNSRTPTSPKAWRKRTGGVELTVPSGNVCLVKRPGMEKLLQAGILPDSLTPIAMEHIKKAESGGRPDSKKDDEDLERQLMEEVMQDPQKITEIFQSFDKVVAMCVVEPKVELHFRELLTEDGMGTGKFEDIPDNERLSDEWPEDNPYYVPEDEVPLYTDEIDPEDKQFIFQFVVGGSSNLEQFRRESGPTLAAAQSGEDVPVSPVEPARHIRT